MKKMAAPNMATIAASLERSLQNCSLNNSSRHRRHNQTGGNESTGIGIGASRSSTAEVHYQNDLYDNISSEASLDLNSQISLPYHWEQCLDLKTGEIYYINWRTGMKAKEDPRMSGQWSGDCYSDDDDEDNSSYGSEEESSSSTETSPSSSRRQQQQQQQQHYYQQSRGFVEKDQVLVVVGCQKCLMYFMLPKQVKDCPKCCGQIMHFDRSEVPSP